MSNFDKEAKYRLALFDEAKELGIENIRSTMSNDKLISLIKASKNSVAFDQLMSEATRIGAPIKNDATLEDLRKAIAKSKNDMVISQLKAVEKKKKIRVIETAKKHNLDLKLSQSLEEMRAAVNKKRRQDVEKPKKKPFYTEAKKLGLTQVTYEMTITEMKKLISAKKLANIEQAKIDRLLKLAKREKIKGIKKGMTRKEIDTHIAVVQVARKKKTKEHKILMTHVAKAHAIGLTDIDDTFTVAKITSAINAEKRAIAAKAKAKAIKDAKIAKEVAAKMAAEAKALAIKKAKAAKALELKAIAKAKADAKKLAAKNAKIDKERNFRNAAKQKVSGLVDFAKHKNHAHEVETNLHETRNTRLNLRSKISDLVHAEEIKIKNFISKAPTLEVKNEIIKIENEFMEKEAAIIQRLSVAEDKLGKTSEAKFKELEKKVTAQAKAQAKATRAKITALLEKTKKHTTKAKARVEHLTEVHATEFKTHNKKVKATKAAEARKIAAAKRAEEKAAAKKIKDAKEAKERSVIVTLGNKWGFTGANEVASNAILKRKVDAHIAKVKRKKAADAKRAEAVKIAKKHGFDKHHGMTTAQINKEVKNIMAQREAEELARVEAIKQKALDKEAAKLAKIEAAKKAAIKKEKAAKAVAKKKAAAIKKAAADKLAAQEKAIADKAAADEKARIAHEAALKKQAAEELKDAKAKLISTGKLLGLKLAKNMRLETLNNKINTQRELLDAKALKANESAASKRYIARQAEEYDTEMKLQKKNFITSTTGEWNLTITENDESLLEVEQAHERDVKKLNDEYNKFEKDLIAQLTKAKGGIVNYNYEDHEKTLIGATIDIVEEDTRDKYQIAKDEKYAAKKAEAEMEITPVEVIVEKVEYKDAKILTKEFNIDSIFVKEPRSNKWQRNKKEETETIQD